MTKLEILNYLEPLWILIQIFLLWLLADFITGIVHWWQDAYGNPTWPIVGKYVVKPNLKHHKDPRGMLKDSYWQKTGASFIVGIILISVFYLAGWHSWRMVLCILMCTQGNEIHAMGHRSDKENGKLIVGLQNIGVIQTRRTHGWHHKAPYDTNFCVMTEFLNPVLNKINFFSRLEFLIEKVFKIKILRGSQIRNGY